MKKTLFLILKNLPFEVTKSGEKSNEYRKPSQFILSRLFNKDGTPIRYDTVTFQCGYGKQAERVVCEYEGVFIASDDCERRYSNGLIVKIEKGDFIIALGKIIPDTRLDSGTHLSITPRHTAL